MFKKITTLSFKERKINYFKKCDRHHETQGNYLNKITYFGGEAAEGKRVKSLRRNEQMSQTVCASGCRRRVCRVEGCAWSPNSKSRGFSH